MTINIISIGSLKAEYAKLFKVYVKKINFYTKLNLIEIKEIKDKNIEVVKRKETLLIQKAIPKNSKVYLCSLKGESYTSKKFSTLLNESNITFIIGGSNGVIEEKFDKKINFSSMTFPHQLFRILVVEQIFRGFNIKNGGKYHK